MIVKPIINFFARLTYVLLVALGHVIMRTPFFMKSTFISVATFLWWDVIKFRRHIVLLNLSVVFARNHSETMQAYRLRLEKIGRKSIWHACFGVIEILERFAWTKETVNERVRFHGFEKLNMFSDGRPSGFFIMTAHLGAWELATYSLVARDVKMAILTRYLRSGFWDYIWVRSRLRFGLRMHGESNSGRAVVRSIRQGYTVAFMMDQHTGSPHGIESNFLGLSAWSPKGLAVLSRALKAPVIEGYLMRDEKGKYDVYIGDLIPGCTESCPDKDEAVDLHVRLCNERMQVWIRQYPEQYLWLHRRFKSSLDYKKALPWEIRG